LRQKLIWLKDVNILYATVLDLRIGLLESDQRSVVGSSYFMQQKTNTFIQLFLRTRKRFQS
jgi:hypothetical protein